MEGNTSCLTQRLKEIALFFSASKNERIQSGLIDTVCYLYSPVGVGNTDPRFFIIIKGCYCVALITDPKCRAYIACNKPDLSLMKRGTNISKLFMMEFKYSVFHF